MIIDTRDGKADEIQDGEILSASINKNVLSIELRDDTEEKNTSGLTVVGKKSIFITIPLDTIKSIKSKIKLV